MLLLYTEASRRKDQLDCGRAWSQALVRDNLEIARAILKARGAGALSRPIWKSYLPLHHAVRWGAENIIDDLLAQGADPDAYTKKRRTPLHFAAGSSEASERVCATLLNAIKKPPDHHRDQFGRTPLFYAVTARPDLIPRLLEAGSDLAAQTYGGQTALHRLVQKHRNETLKRLLPTGGDIDAIRDGRGETLLHAAADADNLDLMEWLLARGASPVARNEKGFEPLHCAAMRGRPLATARLIGDPRVQIDTRDGWQVTALSYAAERCEAACVAVLLEAGADPNSSDNRRDTPLHKALRAGLSKQRSITEEGRRQAALALIEAGADLWAANARYMTPADYAAESGEYEIVREALALAKKPPTPALVQAAMLDEMPNDFSPADLKAKDRFGRTALHHAARLHRTELTQALLQRGASVEARDLTGVRPLHIALGAIGAEPIARLLLEKGATLRAADKQRSRPFDFAILTRTRVRSRHTLQPFGDLLQLASMRQALDWPSGRAKLHPLHQAARSNGAALMALLAQAGANRDVVTRRGDTLVHAAVASGSRETLEAALALAPRLKEKPNRAGFTPLHLAASLCDLDAVHILLDSGADPTRRATFWKSWRTPRHLLMQHLTAPEQRLIPLLPVIEQTIERIDSIAARQRRHTE
ncbi:MAG: ankyrin repeat domain-containing protein [Hyphomonadaceae bacterium JAD_PAG50586_4]|nr:MAG: ankyrin repeat domain-containing protein [Hyphomonadaceae bacterium JAD_PAG50586_4]